MIRKSHPRFVVHCVLSGVAMGCAEKGRILDSDHAGALRPTAHSLIDGDYLALKLQVPDAGRPVSVSLAKVTWVQGERFGVELLLMDIDERLRLNCFFEAHVPLEMKLQDSRSELTITAAE